MIRADWLTTSGRVGAALVLALGLLNLLNTPAVIEVYGLNALVALNAFLIVVGATMAATVAAWEASLPRRQPAVAAREAAAARSPAELLARHALPVWGWTVLAYLGLVCATALRAQIRATATDLAVLVALGAAGLALFVVIGAWLGATLPAPLGMLAAATLAYAVHLPLAVLDDSSVAALWPFRGGAVWAPLLEPRPLAIGLAVAPLLLLAAALVASRARRHGSRGRAKWAAPGAVCLAALAGVALGQLPRSASGQVYSAPADTTAVCTQPARLRLCVPSRGVALLPRLDAGLALVDDVLADLPGVPATFVQRPAAVDGPAVLLEPSVTLGSAPEVAAAAVDASIDQLAAGCPDLPVPAAGDPADTVSGLLWTEVLRDVVLAQAELPTALPEFSDPVAPRVLALSADRRDAWIEAAATAVGRCRAPSVP